MLIVGLLKTICNLPGVFIGKQLLSAPTLTSGEIEGYYQKYLTDQ